MSELASLESLEVDDLRVVTEGGRVVFSGVISMRNPSETITPYLKRVHAAVVRSGLNEVHVDLTELRFMNSSSIRALVDWVEWVRREPSERQYVLHFKKARGVSWQATTLGAIQALGEGRVRVTEAA